MKYVIEVLDIMRIAVNKEKGGLYIQVFSKERLFRSVNNWDLAAKIRKRLAEG